MDLLSGMVIGSILLSVILIVLLIVILLRPRKREESESNRTLKNIKNEIDGNGKLPRSRKR